MENKPLDWIVFQLAFAKENSEKLGEEVSSYCSMLLEGLLYNVEKTVS